jgi:hypothetical protein
MHMNKMLLQVETELDPSAAPRVFGYLGGLGHVPLQAALRRNGADALVIEVQFASQVQAAELISAKVGQMPFVLTAHVSAETSSSANSAPEDVEGTPPAFTTTGGMQHAPAGPCMSHLSRQTSRVDVAALRFAAAQRGQAIHHRSWMHLNA